VNTAPSCHMRACEDAVRRDADVGAVHPSFLPAPVDYRSSPARCARRLRCCVAFSFVACASCPLRMPSIA
jgi:hypothetical protein